MNSIISLKCMILATSQVDWAEVARTYPNLAEAQTFIIRNKESTILTSGIFTDPQLLQGTQLEAYQIVVEHFTHHKDNPLRMIITGTAGTGKSFLIACLKQLLSNKVKITAPTGVAGFNVQGCTLHSLLQLLRKGEFKDLQGESLIKLEVYDIGHNSQVDWAEEAARTYPNIIVTGFGKTLRMGFFVKT